jgi:hypothetical protein
MTRIGGYTLATLMTMAAIQLFAPLATAAVNGLCNTGQTPRTASQCTGVLATPNPQGGGPARDGGWALAYPFPSLLSADHGPCQLVNFVPAWVDTPNSDWLPNSASLASEWITPYAGETNIAAGWYVYGIKFPVPSELPGGIVPTSVTISGQLSSENATIRMYLRSPAKSGTCSTVTLPVPINSDLDWNKWVDFIFTQPVSPGADADLLVLVLNEWNTGLANGTSPAGLRIEFFPSSEFH